MSAILTNDSPVLSRANDAKKGLKIEITRAMLKNSKFSKLEDVGNLGLTILKKNILTIMTGREFISDELDINNSDEFYFYDYFSYLPFKKLMYGFTIEYKDWIAYKGAEPETRAFLKCKDYYNNSYYSDFEILQKDFLSVMQKNLNESKDVLKISFKDNFDEILRVDKTFRKIKRLGYQICFIKNDLGSFDLNFKSRLPNDSEIEAIVSDAVDIDFIKNEADVNLEQSKISHKIIHYLNSLNDKSILIKEGDRAFLSDGSVMLCDNLLSDKMR